MKELPGFTAELSLSKSRGHYAQVMKGAGYYNKHSVLPQIECWPCEPDPSGTGWSQKCCLTPDRCFRSPCEPPPPPPPPPPPDDCWYGHFCGPGCGRGNPIDDLDVCCKEHDKCYKERGYLDCNCDIELIACACPIAIQFWHPTKALAAAAICAIFNTKLVLGQCNQPPPKPDQQLFYQYTYY
jgi:hypothetical protein